MATPLNAELLSKFSIIFSMIFVFAIVFGILQATNLLGKNRGINSIIALVTALMLLFAPNLAQVINVMVPWFVVFLIFIIFTYLIFRFMGASEGDMNFVLKRYKTVLYVVVTISVIIFLGALGKVFFSAETAGQYEFGSDERPTVGLNGTIVPGDVGGPPGEATFWATFFHPKVLGMIFLLLIAMFLIMTMAIPSQDTVERMLGKK